MSFIINAYGQKTICPYTDWVKDALPENLLPINCKDRMVPVFGKDNINSISLEEMRQAVCQQFNVRASY